MLTTVVKTAKKEMVLSPLRTVRKYCLWCCNDQGNEVKLCPVESCALYPYRRGRGPDVKPALTSLKSIRARCVDCSGSAKAASLCDMASCILFPFRDGHNPNLKGRGAGAGVEALRRYREMNSGLKHQTTRRDSETRTTVLV